MRELEIYVHIPFCVKKCLYCDFLSAPACADVQEEYVAALVRQIKEWPEDADGLSPDDRASEASDRVVSIFLGGGTPSILPAGQISRILSAVRSRFDVQPGAEITIECNPGTLSEEKLAVYLEAGISRLSLGLQSAHNMELKMLGRIHTWEQFRENFQAARRCGFSNINIDLISSLPGQTQESWRQTLRKVIALKPEHISAYSLIIEPGTPFYELYHEDDMVREKGGRPKILPSEEDERQMYADTEQILQTAGFHRYEISNYAKPGFESIHNTGYWTRRDYLGFGLGAASLYGHRRWKNTDKLAEYVAGSFERREEEILSAQNEEEETMFLGLRLVRGVDMEEFAKKFGVSVETVYGKIPEQLIGEGLLEQSGTCLRLTPRGMDLANYVMAQFLLT